MSCTRFASHALLLQHQFSRFGVFKKGARLMTNSTQMLDAALNADYDPTLLWFTKFCLLAKLLCSEQGSYLSRILILWCR